MLMRPDTLDAPDSDIVLSARIDSRVDLPDPECDYHNHEISRQSN